MIHSFADHNKNFRASRSISARGCEMYLSSTYSPQYFSILEDKLPRTDINYYKILS